MPFRSFPVISERRVDNELSDRVGIPLKLYFIFLSLSLLRLSPLRDLVSDMNFFLHCPILQTICLAFFVFLLYILALSYLFLLFIFFRSPLASTAVVANLPGVHIKQKTIHRHLNIHTVLKPVNITKVRKTVHTTLQYIVQVVHQAEIVIPVA